MTPPPTVVFLLPDLGGGGAQRVMLTLAEHLDRTRFTPRLMVIGRAETLAVPMGLDVERGNAARLRDGLPWLVRRIRDLKPAVVVSTLAYTNLALLGLKPLLPRSTKLIVREANTPQATLAGLPRLLPGTLFYRMLYPRAARVIAQSEAIAAGLERLAPALGPRMRLLPNPVNVAALRARAAAPLRAEGPGLRLVGVGRLTRQKGFDRLVEIAARLPDDSRVTVLGEGPDRTMLEARIAALGLAHRFTLAGYVADPAPFLAGADALVMPSRWEGLPNAALEALALGTPVIASPGAALGEVAEAAPGTVTIAPDDTGFVGAIARLVPAAPSSPRDSLLPVDYEVGSIVGRLQAILTETLAQG